MKTIMKSALATTALAAVAFVGAATTASAASASTAGSNGIARPGCAPGCNWGYINHYLSNADCITVGVAGVLSHQWVDYLCVRDTSDPSHGPWYDLYVEYP